MRAQGRPSPPCPGVSGHAQGRQGGGTDPPRLTRHRPARGWRLRGQGCSRPCRDRPCAACTAPRAGPRAEPHCGRAGCGSGDAAGKGQPGRILRPGCLLGRQGPSVGTAPCPGSSCLSRSTERGAVPWAARGLRLPASCCCSASRCSAQQVRLRWGLARSSGSSTRCSTDPPRALRQGWGSRAPPSTGRRWHCARCGRARAAASPAEPPGRPPVPRFCGTSTARGRRRTVRPPMPPAPSPSPPGAATASSAAP